MKELVYKKSFENKKVLHNVFVPTNKEWISTENDDLSIIESGKNGVLFNKIIADIHNAQVMICLQSFLIQDTKIIDALLKAKQERGVKIFVMGCAEAKLEANPYGEEDSFITKGYKTMLEEKFKNNFVHRQAGNLHAKFILIDPKTNPKGYLFTGNFNLKPFYENPELAIQLSMAKTKELFQVFVHHFWNHTTDEQTQSSHFDKVKPINKFETVVLKQILLTSPNKDLCNLKTTLLEVILKAEKEIQVSTFGLDINHELSQGILDKLKEGVKVTVFCRPRLKTINGHIEILAKHGAKVFCHPLIHAKSIVVDNTEAYVFSANFEEYGMDTGFEVGLKLIMKQRNDLLKIYDNWKNTFPYEYFNERKLTEIDSYQVLDRESRLKSIIKIEEERFVAKKQHAKTLNELLAFFSINEPKDSLLKIEHVEVVAKLDTLEKYTKVKVISKVAELVEIQIGRSKKNKTEKVLLFDVKEEDRIISLLPDLAKDYKNFKIYAK
ncbi:phospholipase D-like domain-containing protein [Oceanihabitans sp. 2_MG-2023]|uniref:phospholipase D-like domain-containing protein n=1 Tax=Oceanihabitans sp. 2_MG-2023 TaxID=3062661 RepID=UPI0026E18209|nr:phospholipase D-like domain-containing protein [Oceanihabitans sp. 2_MG-2023]MDO6597258.1 phospholipase D-like domain-containing protein [Oceanihabitans sp. 2_MG-2023]